MAGTRDFTTRVMRDPYLDVDTAAARLWAEYQIHKSLIVAFDFDDTVFDFHKVGHTYPKVIKLLQDCVRVGFKLILFTASDPNDWHKQHQCLQSLGIADYAVNRNVISMPIGNYGKPFFNVLLDDRAGLGQACAALERVIQAIDKEAKKKQTICLTFENKRGLNRDPTDVQAYWYNNGKEVCNCEHMAREHTLPNRACSICK